MINKINEFKNEVKKRIVDLANKNYQNAAVDDDLVFNVVLGDNFIKDFKSIGFMQDDSLIVDEEELTVFYCWKFYHFDYHSIKRVEPYFM